MMLIVVWPVAQLVNAYVKVLNMFANKVSVSHCYPLINLTSYVVEHNF